MSVRSFALIVGVGILVCTVNTASAQQPNFEAAKKHYLEGKKLQSAGQTDAAVREFIAAYEITKDPSLFKQIAAAYEAAGRKEEAAIYYRRYLNDAKNASDRDDVKAKIAALEGTAPPDGGGTGDDTQPPDGGGGAGLPMEDDLGPGDDTATGGGDSEPIGPGPTQPTFIDEGSRWQRTAAWISVGLGAVLLTTGAVLGTSALSREDDINRLLVFDPATGLPREYVGSIREDYEDAKEDGEMLDRYAMFAFIGGGVCVSAAIVFFILDATAERPRRGPVVTPTVGGDGAGVRIGWEF